LGEEIIGAALSPVADGVGVGVGVATMGEARLFPTSDCHERLPVVATRDAPLSRQD